MANPMTSRFGGLLGRAFISLLVLLGVVAASLFTVFNFLATAQLSEPLGLVLFIVVTGLLITGYVLGFTVLAFLGIFILAMFWQRKK